MRVRTPSILFLFYFVMLVPATSANAKTLLPQQLLECSRLAEDQQRLACFDALVQEISLQGDALAHFELIQPPADFLNSHLVAVPWKAEYTLTVSSFAKLISQAVMENKKPVKVQGWTRDGSDYVLNITMKRPMKLHFMPRPSANGSDAMSLLRDVNMDGYTIGAGQFILAIAAMVPD